MSSEGTRQRSVFDKRLKTEGWHSKGAGDTNLYQSLQTGKQLTVSESHPRSRKDGSYRSGGPFYTSRVSEDLRPGHITETWSQIRGKYYTGPVYGTAPTLSELRELGYANIDSLNRINQEFGAKNEAQLLIDGTNAISYDNPVNPAAELGVQMGEVMKDGIPSLPGIQLWRQKTEFLKGLGSEYLNYQFGWRPLKEEVSNTVNAARHHRDIMKQYRKGEGSDTHRRFDYPLQRTFKVLPTKTVYPDVPDGGSIQGGIHKGSTRTVSLVRETKKWFEGCYTYALPSGSDSWKKAMGFGSEADHLYGLSLNPNILWELTPWSWAVDWFSNSSEVINNVTNFGLAGLVLRYGYIMCETIETATAEGSGANYLLSNNSNDYAASGNWSRSYTTVTKVRYPASPFGFSIGWEGLSPTQLAITAALGITRIRK